MRAVVVVLVVVGAVMLSCMWGNDIVPMASAEMSPLECRQERKLAGNACKPVAYGKNPPPECCERVRLTHVECVCPYITPKVASFVRAYGLNKIIQKIEGCGRTVPHNAKCGSITTP